MADYAVVTAPSRLHFGMVSIGRTGARQFGGIGVMVARPGLRLLISRAESLTATGPLADRALAFAKRYCDAAQPPADTNYHVEVISAPREHVGLGVGTQLALAVAAGISALNGIRTIDAVRLGQLVGRGERSAIGTHGFQSGGLLFDAGKLPQEAVSPLVSRLNFPPAWRFVLFIPRQEYGVHGMDERQAFESLPPTSDQVSRQLSRSAETLVRAASVADFAVFSEELYQFNRAAGELFARYQRGAYANDRVRRLVEALRGTSIAGVGQSSWGPTVFALTADAASAENLVESCRTLAEARDCTLEISSPQNCGARIDLE